MNDKQFNTVYDVFHAFLVENADYDGYYEMPRIRGCDEIPSGVITFSKAMARNMHALADGSYSMSMTGILSASGIIRGHIWTS